jgi:hypothetical protein
LTEALRPKSYEKIISRVLAAGCLPNDIANGIDFLVQFLGDQHNPLTPDVTESECDRLLV